MSFLTFLTLDMMTLINYHLSIVVDPGRIPEQLEGVALKESRYCKVCDFCRPERAHHCRKCNMCIKRMCHHCEWIGNCVGYGNQGHFARLVFYTSAFCVFTIYIIVSYLMWGIFQADFDFTALEILVYGSLLVLLIPFSAIITFLAWNQLGMLLRNRTTIEELEFQEDRETGLDPQSKYDLGWVFNVSSILGSNPYLWWMPQRMESNGIQYKRIDGEYDEMM
jgi:hypothetical protein